MLLTVILPAVTPTMATMNSQKHIPNAPMMRRRRRPARSISWTPTTVITVFTTSAMILKEAPCQTEVFFRYQRDYELNDERVLDAG